ncbi:winged helix-turn-helix transcriptional regulator [Sphingomonas sp. GB1N7]
MIVSVLVVRFWRFNDLKRTMGGISQQMRTRPLKAFNRDSMVSRIVDSTLPHRRICPDTTEIFAIGATSRAVRSVASDAVR